MSEPQTRAYVLHPEFKNDPSVRASADALDEAVALAAALPDIEIAGSGIIRLGRAQPGTLFGKGKIDELAAEFRAKNVDLVLIDGVVTPVQQRNLERKWQLKLLDRTGLILEIFADRAHTREGVLQVDLAALTYQRTRLVRAWTHLERQRGGLGFVGGPGETQIEADRRAIDAQIGRIRKQLAKVVKTRELHRAARARVPFPIVALVGYTNAGKSTLFNRLTGARVAAQDMLFATLDPTMRAVELADGPKIVLSDTVGFISQLPTQLVAAFRATLEEVLVADLICHVRDISHCETKHQAGDVEAILHEIGVADSTPVIEIWNKMDRLTGDALASRQTEAARRSQVCAISARTSDGVGPLLQVLSDTLAVDKQTAVIELDFGAGQMRAWLYEQGVVEHEDKGEAGLSVRVSWTKRQAAEFARRFQNAGGRGDG